MILRIFLFLTFLQGILLAHPGHDLERTWQNNKGQKIKAILVNFDGKIVELNVSSPSGNKIFKVSFEKFSHEDKKWLSQWLKETKKEQESTGFSEKSAKNFDFYKKKSGQVLFSYLNV